MLSTFTYGIADKYSLPQVQFSVINLSSSSITIISPIDTKLLFISHLILDNNLIQSLTNIQQFMNLQTLSINFNFISNTKQLLKINHKFLIRTLSYIGNPIQNLLSMKELYNRGFYNLAKLNDIKAIGEINYNKRWFIVNKNNIQERQSLSNLNKPSKTNNHQLTSKLRQSVRKQQQNMNQTLQLNNSRYIYLTKRNNNNSSRQQMTTKRQYLSTGDTTRKRKKLSSSFRQQRQLLQQQQNNSIYKSHQSIYSPSFNKLYHQYNNNKSSEHKQYRQTISNRKITQFNLYPVDQYQQPFNNKNKNIRINNTKNIITPFIQSQQRQYHQHNIIHNEQHRDYYQNPFNNKQSQQQQQSQEVNNHNGFQLIQKQIPIYKQAIAIAFYYRNLLQKVFIALSQSIVGKQHTLKSQQQHRLKSQQQQHLYYPPQQLSLLRSSFMKIQLYSNYQKIIQKYQSNRNKI